MVCWAGSSFHSIGPAQVGLVTKRLGRRVEGEQLVALKGEAGYQADLLMPGLRFKFWPLFKELIGNPEWANSPTFDEQERRNQNIDALMMLIEPWFMERTQDEIVHAAQAKRLLFGRIKSIDQVVNSAQAASRDFFVEGSMPTGPLTMPGTPYLIPQLQRGPLRKAPRLGEHNADVLAELRQGSRA